MGDAFVEVEFQRFWRRLQQLGLNAYESRSYLVLLGHPKFKALELAARAQLNVGMCRMAQKRYADAGAALLVVPYTYDYPELNALALLEAARAFSENKQPGQAVRLLDSLTGGLAGLRVAVLGAAYRAGVKETAFSGVFAITRELGRRAALPLVHDPLYTESELCGLGFVPYCLGEPCNAAIVHTDHPEYSTLTPADLPGIRALVDGRAIIDPRPWSSVPLHVLGIGGPAQPAGERAHRQPRTQRAGRG